MEYLYTAPDRSYRDNKRLNLFMAGGCGGCPEWQKELGEKLAKLNKVNILNPMRKVWPSERPEIEDQILWEHEGLKESKVMLFWFPQETLCPITLFELGRWSYGQGKRIVVGAHPKYARRQDLEIQLQMLEEPITVLSSLEELYESVSTLLLRSTWCPK